MNYSKLRLIFFSASFAFCLWLQIATYLNGDTLWLVHISTKLLEGKKYYYDFFEVNMPMSAYVYMPAVIISKLLGLNFITTTIVYLLVLASFSWLFCSSLLNRLFSHNAYLTFWLELTLLFIYFWLPAFNFGEREYLLVVLLLPYVLLSALRLQQQSIHNLTAYTAGLMAGIGLTLKPYFLVFWPSIELYLLIKTKNIKLCYRAENLSCLLLFIIYGISLVFITPEYFTKITPIISHFYYTFIAYPILVLLQQQVIYFSVLLGVIYGFLRKKSVNNNLLDLLAICLLGSLFIYLIQRVIWNYHMLPIFMIGSLMIVLLLAEFLPKNNIFKMHSFNRAYLKSAGIALYLLIVAIFPSAFAVNCIKYSFIFSDKIFNNMPYRFTKTIRGQSIYIFTNNMLINYPAIDYSQTPSPSHFPCLWLLSAAQKLYFSTNNPDTKLFAMNIANDVRTTEINALLQNKPNYILIPLTVYNTYYAKTGLLSYDFKTKETASFNFFNFFLEDPRFAQLWWNYKYVGQFDRFAVYKLNIY